MGAVFQVSWTCIGQRRDWAEEGCALLHEQGFKTCALALDDDALALQDKRLTLCDKLALVLGFQGDGLARPTIASCDFVAKIPMCNDAGSLNVAAASAVAFWELCARKRA